MTRRSRFASRFAGLRITPGAMVIAGLEIGLSLVWLLSDPDGRLMFDNYLAATPTNVFEHGRVWTLVTSPFLEHGFINILLHAMVLWMFVPTLERFWGTPRFYRFFAVTSLLATAVGVSVGYLIYGTSSAMDAKLGILGLSPFIYASIVAYGIVYARQQVQFFGVLPLTGRQLMYGFLGFVMLYVLMLQLWWLGAAFAAAMLAAALMTSKRFSPGLAWKRWRIARARRKLSVVDGGTKPRRDEQKWLN